jgi:RNA polymerase sigma-70 factor (ECF subfamily)
MHRARTRRPQTVPFDDSIEFAADRSTDPGVLLVELRSIYAAIHELSPILRDTLVAVDVIGLSYKQAALALEAPEGTIMSRLSRARDQVAEKLVGGNPNAPSSLESEQVARSAPAKTLADPG